jgi:hypothetical protein
MVDPIGLNPCGEMISLRTKPSVGLEQRLLLMSAPMPSWPPVGGAPQSATYRRAGKAIFMLTGFAISLGVKEAFA